jgi:hypothetical protein
MATACPHKPVSEKILDMIIKVLKVKKITPGMLGWEKGQNPSEIVFLTTKGKITCPVREVSSFVYFELPSGKRMGFVKKNLISNA